MVAVMRPAAGLPMLAFGRSNCGVLNRLKNSARYCRRQRSLATKSLNIDQSKFTGRVREGYSGRRCRRCTEPERPSRSAVEGRIEPKKRIGVLEFAGPETIRPAAARVRDGSLQSWRERQARLRREDEVRVPAAQTMFSARAQVKPRPLPNGSAQFNEVVKRWRMSNRSRRGRIGGSGGPAESDHCRRRRMRFDIVDRVRPV